MIRIQNIHALLMKQIKDTLKNPPILVLFLVYPIIAFMMINAMKNQPGAYAFLSIFATMHCIFTPVVTTATILSEEKEKSTLRVLIMAGVNLPEYFISTCGFVLISSIITGSSFLFLTQMDILQSATFLASMALGSTLSIILGICVALYAKNATAANGLAVPFGMIFAFFPMLSHFNKGLEAISFYTFGQQISYLFQGETLSYRGILILVGNTFLLFTLATLLYRKTLTR